MRRWSCIPLFVAVVLPAVSGCIPYTVGTTAQPVPKGETVPIVVWYAITGGIEYQGDSAAVAWSSMDLESRLGVSDRADVGIRIPALTGLVATYKYRLTSSDSRTDPAIAFLGGGGIVNWGNHAHFEATLLASARQKLFTPYGGLRVAQVLPLSSGAVSDSPTAGGFFGCRLGREQLGVSAEVGVFYDRSALGLRSGDVIVVPALVIHGWELVELVTGRR